LKVATKWFCGWIITIHAPTRLACASAGMALGMSASASVTE